MIVSDLFKIYFGLQHHCRPATTLRAPTLRWHRGSCSYLAPLHRRRYLAPLHRRRGLSKEHCRHRPSVMVLRRQGGRQPNIAGAGSMTCRPATTLRAPSLRVTRHGAHAMVHTPWCTRHGAHAMVHMPWCTRHGAHAMGAHAMVHMPWCTRHGASRLMQLPSTAAPEAGTLKRTLPASTLRDGIATARRAAHAGGDSQPNIAGAGSMTCRPATTLRAPTLRWHRGSCSYLAPLYRRRGLSKEHCRYRLSVMALRRQGGRRTQLPR
jgi:hypothetical protein